MSTQLILTKCTEAVTIRTVVANDVVSTSNRAWPIVPLGAVKRVDVARRHSGDILISPAQEFDHPVDDRSTWRAP